MAELFVAVQRGAFGFEKLVVVKRILRARTVDRSAVDMLLHEARIAATLSHPNIVQVLDVDVADNDYFIAMEHVHGEDLRSIVREMKAQDIREFPVEHALSVVLGICAGLAYAHGIRGLDGTPLNIVHRDISPQNVIVAYAGGVKIVDFGIAQSDAMAPDGTRSGRLKGKVPYMSPEQARGDAVDHRSDIFSAGVILFELTTGRRLFKAANETEAIELICDRAYPRPSEALPGYPAELEAIVMRALAKDRADRWQTAIEMQAAIEDFALRERIPVSAVGLSKFMHSLFAEKLTREREALLRGKQAADSAREELDKAMLSVRTSSIPPMSARTIAAAAKVASPAGLVVGMGALAALLLAGEVLWWRHQPPPTLPQSPEVATGAASEGGLPVIDAGSLR
jgi:serine/threonine-protein kinase